MRVLSRLSIILASAAVAVGALAAAPAGAVTSGQLDGDGHPFVGLMVAQDGQRNPLWRCSGTLLSPTVFLTAGHCTEAPAAHVEIWFDADLTDADLHDYPFTGDVGGTPFTHPDYDPDAFFVRDLGVVVLDAPVEMAQYGTLPSLNQLDGLKTKRGQQDVTFTAVGYGLQQSFPDPASFLENNQRIRMVATPRLLQINVPGFTGDYSVLLSNNTATGGTCSGDSGGPNFLGTSTVVAGVTSFGMNVTCAGTGGVFRMDRSWALDWVKAFLDGSLPD